MNLLLLLSALLSALSGFGVSARVAQPAQVFARQVSAPRAVALPARAAVLHPLAALPRLTVVAQAPMTAAPFVAAWPHWIDRRRE